MSYQALARKWRPKTFDQVIGQEHVVSALTNALDNERVHHAFLFTGTRGVGKTTLARIFAKALNCEQGIRSMPCGECVPCRGVDQGNFVDLIEVDAASRTKVDDTRELLDNVQYTPTQGRFKIYLIDEVHMLSTHSFNALLKTLEEPPTHVKFLLATTDPQKLPSTILSRCIQFNLKAMDIGRLIAQLEKILDAEKIDYDQAAILILARSANGSVRDALSLLDQAIAYGNGEVRTEQIRAMLGMIDDQSVHQLLEQICLRQTSEALQTVSDMALRSADFSNAIDEILTLLHNVSLYQVSPQAVEWKGIDSAGLAQLSQLADAELLQLLYQIALMGKRDLPFSPDPRSGFEMVLLRMISFQPQDSEMAGNARSRGTALEQNRDPNGAAKISSQIGHGEVSGAGHEPGKPEPLPALDEPHSEVPVETGPASKLGADGETAAAEATLESTAGNEPQVEPTASPSTDFKVVRLEQLISAAGWAEYTRRCDLKGMSREMAVNMVPDSVNGRTIRFTLDARHGHLLNENRLKKIAQCLSDQLSDSIEVKIDVSEVSGEGRETPSQRRDRAQREEQVAAQQAFSHDPNVQRLVDLFDAEIVNESIQPASH